jgi:3-oxoacyl-(acyl-carrier-protein) synthase
VSFKGPIRNRLPTFFTSKYCNSSASCADRSISRFKSGKYRYAVCGSSEACSCKSNTPVKVKEHF